MTNETNGFSGPARSAPLEPEQPETQIRAIQPGSVITFPCWLYGALTQGGLKGPLGWWHAPDREYWSDRGWQTHYHPEQPEMPTLAPALHVIREEQKQKPEVDSVINATRGERGVYDELDRMTALARKLEGERDAWKASDNRHCQTLHEISDVLCGRKNNGYLGIDALAIAKSVAEKVADLTEWKRQHLAVAAWWSECDSFVRNDPEMKIGDSVSGKCLEFLQERKRLLLEVTALREVRSAILGYQKITDTEYALGDFPDAEKYYKPEFVRLLKALHDTMNTSIR